MGRKYEDRPHAHRAVRGIICVTFHLRTMWCCLVAVY